MATRQQSAPEDEEVEEEGSDGDAEGEATPRTPPSAHASSSYNNDMTICQEVI